MKKVYFACLLLVTVFAGGCGSDGWPDPDPTDPDPPGEEKLLEGRYLVSRIVLDTNNGAAERIVMDFTENNVSVADEDYIYTLNGKALTIPDVGDGNVHKDGRVFSIVDTTNPVIALYIGIKEGSSVSPGVLSGDYVVSQFGAIASTDSDPDLSGFTIGTNGSMTSSHDRGIIDSSGEIFSLANGSSDTIKVGMKKSLSRSTEDLEGRYLVNVIAESNTTNPFTAQFNMELDGKGNGKITVVKSSLSISGTREFTYSVNNDGTLNFEEVLVGIVSPDAQSFTMAIDLTDILPNSSYTGTGLAFGIAQ